MKSVSLVKRVFPVIFCFLGISSEKMDKVHPGCVCVFGGVDSQGENEAREIKLWNDWEYAIYIN